MLWAEAKLGELLKKMEPKYSMGSVEGTNRPHRGKTLPEGITKKQSHEAQQLADNPEEIREVIQEAKIEKEIPTKGKVLQLQKDMRQIQNAHTTL